jgi:hypothetical protein
MADINVQLKRSRPWWLWLLLIVIAVVIAYFIFHGRSGEATKSSADSATTSGQNK